VTATAHVVDTSLRSASAAVSTLDTSFGEPAEIAAQ
jgi:hypothetical protein